MSDKHIGASTRVVSYRADGYTYRFSFPFIVWNGAGIDVYVDDELCPKIDYTVYNIGIASGGYLIFRFTPRAGDLITIVGTTVRERAVDYNQYVTLTADNMNLDANYQETQIQENTTALKRTMLTPIADGIPERQLILPGLKDRRNAYFAFDRDGNPIALGEAQNIVHGPDVPSSVPEAVVLWDGDSGRKIKDSKRIFGRANGAATLNEKGLVPKEQLPKPANIILAGTNVHVRENEDGTLTISAAASPVNRYVYPFDADSWNEDFKLIIPPELHNLGEQSGLLVALRDAKGDQVFCDVNVSSNGTVTVETDTPFAGTLIIFGTVTFNEALLGNPMTRKGDIIYGGENGKPQRLGIGTSRQVLVVNSTREHVEWDTLGAAAWKGIDMPYGVPTIGSNGMIAARFLPLNTMTYKGTFGGSGSTTGGDLPLSVLDGDIYVCNSDSYFSSRANKTFSVGQMAIYNGSSWEAMPYVDANRSVPVGTILPFIGSSGSLPTGFLACNGYTLTRSSYLELYNIIGTKYNKGSERSTEFSIPNYNNEGLFLQGSTTAGTKREAGLPNITGEIGYDQNANDWLKGCFKNIGGAKGASGGSWNNFLARFDASYSNPIYGNSETVQPPAHTVIFMIKYR